MRNHQQPVTKNMIYQKVNETHTNTTTGVTQRSVNDTMVQDYNLKSMVKNIQEIASDSS